MSELVDELRAQALRRVEQELDAALRNCESPIEQALLLGLVRLSPWLTGTIGVFAEWPGGVRSLPLFRAGIRLGGGALALNVAPQVEVDAAGERYRIDLAVECVRDSRPPVFVAVECDGHDYHERTKEQAERDKARDRALQMLGWRVARFTGAEIWRDAEQAALRLYGFCSVVTRAEGDAP